MEMSICVTRDKSNWPAWLLKAYERDFGDASSFSPIVDGRGAFCGYEAINNRMKRRTIRIGQVVSYRDVA